METLVGLPGTVKFYVPAGLTNATFVVKRKGTQIGTTANASIADNIASCTLPYAAVVEPGEVTVDLTFNFQSVSHSLSENVEVVTPILPLYEVKEIVETTDDKEAIRVERAVRRIIQTHCGQRFQKYVGVKTVWGTGDPFLTMPLRLESLNTINGYTANVDLRNHGWMLMATSLKSVEWRPTGMNHPITNPYSRGLFRGNTSYAIDGVWGWSTVPVDVQEAARLLVNDYACGDSAYRDRFIEAMTAADWRIQFNAGAYINTGNVRANQLLEPYRVSRLAII